MMLDKDQTRGDHVTLDHGHNFCIHKKRSLTTSHVCIGLAIMVICVTLNVYLLVHQIRLDNNISTLRSRYEHLERVCSFAYSGADDMDETTSPEIAVDDDMDDMDDIPLMVEFVPNTSQLKSSVAEDDVIRTKRSSEESSTITRTESGDGEVHTKRREKKRKLNKRNKVIFGHIKHNLCACCVWQTGANINMYANNNVHKMLGHLYSKSK